MHLTQVFKNFDTGNVMKIIALLGFLCGCVAAQSQSDGKVIGDRAPATAPLEIGVGQQAAAMIDCTRTFECELVSYDPVCGSDGITFANDCVFASTFCSEENDPNTLFIQAAGVCPSFPEDNGEEAPDASSTTPSSSIPDENELQSSDQTESTTEVDLKTVFCSITCKLTPDQVCGTDGVTYINDCHLLSSKCEHPGLKKAAHGECAPDKEANAVLNVLEVHSETTTNEVLTTPPEKCNPMCERIYDPICGSDGITYANSCLLEYAECRNPSIKVFGAGKCPPHMVAARSASASTNTNGGESCVPGPCPYTYAPVCGSDGQTHENLCLFANAWCQHPQHALKVLHDGECDADTQITCETMTCPSYTECREQIEPDSTVVAYCADICSPDRCSEREDCELIDSDCFTAPCSPVAMCIPKIQEG